MTRDNQHRMGFVQPMSVVPDRYGGTYSKRKPWLAFPCDPWDVPREPFEDDTTAREWWGRVDVPIGGGSTPNEACLNLIESLVAIRPEHVYGPNAGHQKYLWTWEIRWPDGNHNVVDSMLEPSDWTPGGGFTA
jgi:hypothetical protein